MLVTALAATHPGGVGYVTSGDGGSGGGDPTPTLWIATTGNDTTGDGSSGNPYLTQAKAVSVMSPGDVLGLKGTAASPQTYTDGWTTLPVGTDWTTPCHIVAEEDGGAIVTGGLSLSTNTNWYCTVRGLLFDSATQKSILGKQWKFFRTGFKGAPATGNVSRCSIGSNDFDPLPGAQYGLLEDCWAYGSGGRYGFQVYDCDRVILRRCVVRHDGGWSNGGNPQAAFALYNCSNTWFVHPISIDSTLAGQEAEVYVIWNAGVARQDGSGNAVLGGLVVQGQGSGAFKMDTASAFPYSVNFTHCLAHGDGTNGYGFLNNGPNSTMVLERCTAIKCLGAGRVAFAAYQTGGVTTLSGCLAEDCQTGVSGAITYAGTNRGWNFLDGSPGSLTTDTDPETIGLTYPMRIETGSQLVSEACGADIRNQIGVSGSLYGDSGWLTVTGDALWPWPNQARIRTDMLAVSNRGFCGVGEDLTHYIANLLGNGSPY